MPKKLADDRTGILIVAPTGNDAVLAASVLAEHEVQAEVCPDLITLAERIEDQTDAVVIAQEAIIPAQLTVLVETLGKQAPWSDLPLIILASSGSAEAVSQRVLGFFGPSANVTLLERPFSVASLVSTVRGATRARQRQRDVRDLLEQRESLLASISDAFSAIDRNWRYTYVNDRVAELAGVPKNEIIGRSIWEVFPQPADSQFSKRAHQAMKARQPDRFDEFYKPWGRWLETRIYPNRDGLVIYRADITETIAREQKLQRNEERLQIAEQRIRLAVDAAHLGTFDYYPPTGELRWSERCNELFGLPPAAKPDYATYLRGIHADDRYLVDETQRRVVAPDSSGRYEIEYRTVGLNDGVQRWVAEKGRAILDVQGRPVRFLGTLLDMTEQRRADAERRRALDTLNATLVGMSDGFVVYDRDFRFLMVNPAIAAINRMTPEEMLGRSLWEVFPDLIGSVTEEKYRYSMERREALQFDSYFAPFERWYENRCQSIADGLAVFISDITERKRSEEALSNAKVAAETANRAKDQFLAMLSHELRTPLTPVLMTTVSLQNDPSLPDHLRDDVDILRRNVELEALLIDDLLDLTRITHGKLELHHDVVDVHASLAHALSIAAGELGAKRIAARRDFAAREHQCWADSARLQQAFWNIIKNAVKFTPAEGELRISTRNDTDHRIIIEFTDTGVGIAPELQMRIFDAFEQGGQRVTSRYGGLGLGLAISKRVVDLHGGEIRAQSEGPNRGATFTIILQAMATSLLDGPVYPIEQPVLDGHPADILLVEDHADTARLMQRMLEHAGYRVTFASNLAAARAAIATQRFQLLISDLGLPDGSGIDLMRELRATHPIAGIALSGFGMEADIAAAKECGFAEHFTKPVDWERLRQAIARQLAPGEA